MNITIKFEVEKNRRRFSTSSRSRDFGNWATCRLHSPNRRGGSYGRRQDRYSQRLSWRENCGYRGGEQNRKRNALCIRRKADG